MKTLDLYIGTNFLRGFLLVLSILVILFSFLEFVVQLDDIGRGNYHLQDALVFLALTLPRRILDLIGVSSLLGSIISLGLLADSNELLAMQASGLSVRRICWSVLGAGALIMAVAGILTEFVVPPMEQQARMRRLVALSDPEVTVTKTGFWARNGPYFIHVRKTPYGLIAAEVDIYEHDKKGRLQTFTHAREADIHGKERWLLKDVEQRVITDQNIDKRHLSTLTLKPLLGSRQITIQDLAPDSISVSDLYQCVRMLRESGQNADRYALALWKKLSLPLITGAMVLLSLPFVFGSTRRITAGERIMMGSIVGIVLYLASQIIGHLGLLLSLNPALATLTPAGVVCWVALWRLRHLG